MCACVCVCAGVCVCVLSLVLLAQNVLDPLHPLLGLLQRVCWLSCARDEWRMCAAGFESVVGAQAMYRYSMHGRKYGFVGAMSRTS